jgi:hypothetical protein
MSEATEAEATALRTALENLIAMREWEYSRSNFQPDEFRQVVALNAVRNILADPVGVGELLRENLARWAKQ